jgi:hypothetical protein
MGALTASHHLVINCGRTNSCTAGMSAICWQVERKRRWGTGVSSNIAGKGLMAVALRFWAWLDRLCQARTSF